MLMSGGLFVNAVQILLNHVIRCPVLAGKFGDEAKVRIFVLCFS